MGTLNTLEALRHLLANPNNVTFYTNEWSEAGMFNAVCEIMGDEGKLWTTAEIDALIERANNN